MDRLALATSFRRRGTVIGVGVNLLGAALVVVYLVVVFPPEGQPRVLSLGQCLGLALVYVALATVHAKLRGQRLGDPMQDWLRAGREPAADECRQLMRLPASEAKLALGHWLFGLPVFALLGLNFSGTAALEVATAVFLTALTVAALDYLLFERMLRPAVAIALASSARPEAGALGVGPRALLTWALCSGVPVVMLLLIPVGRGSEVGGRALIAPIWFVGVLALIAGAVTVKLTTQAVTRPVRELRRALDSVAEGDLDVAVSVDDGSEIGRLQAGFNGMVADLRERERLRDLYGRAVGADVAREALERAPSLGGGAEREVSALFVDVIGSTALAQREPPARVVALLNGFFAEVVDVVHAHGGLVNKFEGDAALCVFGVPGEQPDHAARALAAARALRRRLDLRAGRLGVAMGVASGTAVAGWVGAESRFEYTVIGDPINCAARLSELAKQRPGRLLADAATVRAARADGSPEIEQWAEDGEVVLRGRRAPTRLAVPRPVGAAKPQGAVSSAGSRA